jgi:hypothetical protein
MKKIILSAFLALFTFSISFSLLAQEPEEEMPVHPSLSKKELYQRDRDFMTNKMKLDFTIPEDITSADQARAVYLDTILTAKEIQKYLTLHPSHTVDEIKTELKNFSVIFAFIPIYHDRGSLSTTETIIAHGRKASEYLQYVDRNVVNVERIWQTIQSEKTQKRQEDRHVIETEIGISLDVPSGLTLEEAQNLYLKTIQKAYAIKNFIERQSQFEHFESDKESSSVEVVKFGAIVSSFLYYHKVVSISSLEFFVVIGEKSSEFIKKLEGFGIDVDAIWDGIQKPEKPSTSTED